MSTFKFYFILLLTALISIQSWSNGLKCTELFKNEAEVSKVKIGLSLTYSPVLKIDSADQSFDDYVFIETFKPGFANPVQQRLIPYTNGISGVEAFGRDFLHEVGLQAIYQNYGSRVPIETIQLVQKVEKTLPLERQAVYLVKSNIGSIDIHDVSGMMRIFDGSIYQNGVRKFANPALPLEKILKAQGKSTNIINEKREQGFDVFEVGKYFLAGGMSGKEFQMARQSILIWWVDYLESRGEETLSQCYFYAHVASRTHQIAYQRNFHFKTTSRLESQGLADNENILEIRGDILIARLRAAIISKNKSE